MGKGSTKIPTPGVNLYLAWNPHDPNMMATGSDSNVVSFIDIRRNKVLRSVKNSQLVRITHINCISSSLESMADGICTPVSSSAQVFDKKLHQGENLRNLHAPALQALIQSGFSDACRF